ncbi:hypothetical protein [Acinetobacter pittii]|uniref:hypothetical protein n=1 Tax=Acinetobacter pittii TaxID=48296 RepID=UPI0009D0D9FD|nr:hypothetical protein [Acinetobacter pittii]OOT51115.1 hypothetical protein BTG92_13395 [Acinetobacter pittii]OOT51239.1 hypothetical protein BTG92_14115 [Acinetobacter pittii]
MRIEQMPGYGYPALAYWLEYCYEVGKWKIIEYKYLPDGTLKWFDQYYEHSKDVIKLSIFNTKKEALQYVNFENLNIHSNISSLALSEIEEISLSLKVEKSIQAKSRLMKEEELMLTAAVNKHTNKEKITYEEVILPANEESFKDDLFKQLSTMPYLKIALVDNGKEKRIIYKSFKNDWSKTYIPYLKTLRYAERAKIANAFNLSFDEHWGRIKAKIRIELLPLANKLLQLESVKKLLKEAEAKGKKVLVSNGYVFWFEEDGNIGWQIKQVKPTESSNTLGETIWKEGTILSKNHGRLVILPYVKENGEYVQGHTKNAPHDGPAKPRAPSEYVELPFEILEDDLMIGLFGELKYE